MRWIALAALLPATALADQAIEVKLEPKVLEGRGMPGLVVHAREAIVSAQLLVTRSTDGRALVSPKTSIPAGRSFRFPLEHAAPGSARFEGSLKVTFKSGETGELPIAVDTELVRPPELTLVELDVPARRLRVRSTRPIRRLEVSATSDTGTPLGTSEGRYDPAEENAEIALEMSAGTLFSLHAKAFDPDNFFGALELFPWRLDIPHEEVTFPSGDAVIPKAEAAKLEASAAKISDALKKYGRLAKLKLYVGGHTDTVGSAEANLELSRRRAESIGRWFKSKRLAVPIFVAGFGEGRPWVETADESDEPKNRRAEYIIAVEAPGPSFTPLP